jgi:hypothetical protein
MLLWAAIRFRLFNLGILWGGKHVVKLAKITTDLDKGKGVMMGSLNTVMKVWTVME